jgi:DNA recombination protein RmuC
VLKDHRLRERAHEIQDEVRLMMLDVERLDERVGKLASHFGSVQRDVEQITISSGKITKRGRGISEIGIETPAPKLAAEQETERLPGLPFESS